MDNSLMRKRRLKYMEMLEMVSYCDKIIDQLSKLKKKMPEMDTPELFSFECHIDQIRQSIIRKELDLIAGIN